MRTTGSTIRASGGWKRQCRPSRILAIGVLAVAGCGNDSPAGPDVGAASVAGSVTRQKTGVGVTDAIAVITAGGHVVSTTHTDGAGRFTFGRLDAGVYTVQLTGIEFAGLDPRFDALEPRSRTVTVPAAEDLVFAVVGLVAPRVTGQIRCGGLAVAGAEVRVIGGSTDTTAVTDALGRYAQLDLAPGNYAVIPVAAPCTLAPPFVVVDLRPGQSGEADFAG